MVLEIGGFYVDMTKVLGAGSSAKVVLATDKVTGRKYAAKIVPKTSQKNPTKAYLQNELSALRVLKHPNIISLAHVEDTPTHTYIFTEYCQGGDLVSVVSGRGCLREHEAKKLFSQLLDAVHYCHASGYSHRDIKLENCLMTENDLDKGKLKLADFGFCVNVSDSKPLTSYCGSPSFVAPEIIKKIPYDGKACDVWGLGVVLYAMLYGFLPFGDDSDMPQLFHNIVNTPVHFPPSAHPISDQVKRLIAQMLNKDGALRPTIAAIRAHPWFTEHMTTQTPTATVGTRFFTTTHTTQHTKCQAAQRQWAGYMPHKSGSVH